MENKANKEVMTQELSNVSMKDMFAECGIQIEEVERKDISLSYLSYEYPISGGGHPHHFTLNGKALQKGWLVSLIAAKKAYRFYDEEKNQYYSCTEKPQSEKGVEDKKKIEELIKQGKDVVEGMKCLVFVVTKENEKTVSTYAELCLFKSLFKYMWKNLCEGKAQDGKLIQVNLEDHSCNVKNNRVLQGNKFKQITSLPITATIQDVMKKTLEAQKELISRWVNY